MKKKDRKSLLRSVAEIVRANTGLITRNVAVIFLSFTFATFKSGAEHIYAVRVIEIEYFD